jgi:hypothetical protein
MCVGCAIFSVRRSMQIVPMNKVKECNMDESALYYGTHKKNLESIEKEGLNYFLSSMINLNYLKNRLME